MNIAYELLIIIAISLFWSFFAGPVLCFGKDEHHYIRTHGVEAKNYLLKKSIFLFVPVFVITRNWKTGIIRKDSFWSLISLYIYQLCFFVADLIFYLITQNNMVYEKPIIFVILALIPLLALFILRGAITIVLLKENAEQ